MDVCAWPNNKTAQDRVREIERDRENDEMEEENEKTELVMRALSIWCVLKLLSTCKKNTNKWKKWFKMPQINSAMSLNNIISISVN